MHNQIEPSWKKALTSEFTKSYFVNLTAAIDKAYRTEKVYPAAENIFQAFAFCPLDQVKVVILGQDPYHGADQAQGLSFSVPDNVKMPPSLRNIYKEIKSDCGSEMPESGDLEHWAKQGVLLLNSTLTVEAGNPASHQGLGWESFTDEVIKIISTQKEHVVFLLWGKFAEAKSELIDETKHLILTTSHPSPFSAHRGFLGSKHFTQTNNYLKKNNLTIIKW